MIEINGTPDPNAFDQFDDFLKGKKEVIFTRTDVSPLKVYENWKGEKEGYGPSGSPVAIGQKHTISIPMDFYTLRNFKEGTAMEQIHVRYYVTKTPVTLPGGIQTVNYDAGDGVPHLLFEGDSMKINVRTVHGRELYRVLMAHPCNQEHPAKGPKKPPLFKLMRPEQISKEANERTKLENKAIGLLYNEDEVNNNLLVKLHKHVLSENPIIGWVPTDELVETEDWDTMRSDLSGYAKVNAEGLIKLISTANVGIIGLVNDCKKAGIVDYMPETSRWYWGKGVKRNIPEICDVAVGQDPVDALVAFIVYDEKGRKTQEVMQTEIKKAKQGSGG